jgi:hypothetical protein
MRRVVGAGLLIVLLGGGHVVRWLGDGLRKEPPALDAPSMSQPRLAPGEPAPPRARRASAPATPYPAAYHADPLRFLSTAPPDSLALLPGIGPVLAARIAGDRAARGPFTRWTELDRVRGVGPATIRRLEAAARRR